MSYTEFENDQAPDLSAETLNRMQIELMKLVFPVGSTYITQTNTNPSAILKFGTWERLKGRVCVGLDENDEYFNAIGKEVGESEHTLIASEMPSHSHEVVYANNGKKVQFGGDGTQYKMSWNADGFDGGAELIAASTGGNQSHNNIQKTKVVGYMWIRTT